LDRRDKIHEAGSNNIYLEFDDLEEEELKKIHFLYDEH
jgi:uncharacterized radical SAM superfamily Fe-S cluster-containing enzyme